jgi:hypothetical protein
MELKFSHQIIKTLHEDRTNKYNIKSQVESQNFIPKVSTEVSRTRMKLGKAKDNIQILRDSHARGLANEFKLTPN